MSRHVPHKLVRRWRHAVWLLPVFLALLSGSSAGRAAGTHPASLALDPAGGTFTVNQSFSVNIMLNTGSVNIQGVDVLLNYDSKQLQVKDDNAVVPGVQIQTVNQMPGATVFQTVDSVGGTIRYSVLVPPGVVFSNTTLQPIATIHFNALAVGTAEVKFDFDLGNRDHTKDSNIVSSGGLEELGRVTHGSYIITPPAVAPPPLPAGSCLGETCVASNLDANIYAISYNEGAGEPTEAIFDELVKNWRFNVNLTSPGACEQLACSVGGAVCPGTLAVGDACDNGRGICHNIACSSDLDCPGQPDDSCLNPQAKIRRDAIRFGQLQDLQFTLRAASGKRGGAFPLWDATRRDLSGGTYVPGQSFSVWPSWGQTFAQQLGATPPVDPLNTFVGCRTPYDETTCWDERALTFGCPGRFYVYGYQVDKTVQGKDYRLHTSFEYPADQGGWSDPRFSIPELESCFNFFALGIGDGDADGVYDREDNCVGRFNPYECVGGTEPSKTYCPRLDKTKCTGSGTCKQPDGDGDQLGNACDPCPNAIANDPDHDGVCENGLDNPQYGYREDNCPSVPNPDQRDADSDGVGDACDTDCAQDLDRDGICDVIDNCPTVFNPDQTNQDGLPVDADLKDGHVWPNGQEWGDACDLCTDPDKDGWGSGLPAESCRRDNCQDPALLPFAQSRNPNQEDFDNDGVGYLCDSCIDSDNDELTDQLVGNSSFEDGLNGWRLFTQNGVDVQLRHATDYLRLADYHPSRNHGRAYRGVHSAAMLIQNLGPGKYVALRSVKNPQFIATAPDYIVRYVMQARVHPSDPRMVERLRFRPIRACTKLQTKAGEHGLEYKASCQDPEDLPTDPVTTNKVGFRVPLRQPVAVQNLGDGWYSLRSEFLADRSLANDPIAFELALENQLLSPVTFTNATLYVDDFTVGYLRANNAESCRRPGGPTLGINPGAELYRPMDNCRVLNNPTRCVGGRFHGAICLTSSDCINPAHGSVKVLTMFERSGEITSYAFDVNGTPLTTDRDEMADAKGGNAAGDCDIWTSEQECYDLFWSDSTGGANPAGLFLTIAAYRDPAATTPGHNIDAVRLDLVSGAAVYAERALTPNAGAALGSPNSVATALGNESTSMTLDFGLAGARPFLASCLEILQAGQSSDGILPDGNNWYHIDVNRDGTADEQVYCDMETDGGGWTLVAWMQDDTTQNWVRQKNSEMATTWWFDGQSHNADRVVPNDYKARAFNTIPLSDIMVTVHDDVGGFEQYAVWRNGIADGLKTFADQPIWKASYCPAFDPAAPLKSGLRGTASAGAVTGLVLGPRDSLAAPNVCAKKLSVAGIADDLSAADTAVVAIVSGPDAKDPNPHGLGNWNAGDGFNGFLSTPDYGVLTAGNYGQLWFRERPVFTGASKASAAAAVAGGVGVCLQPDYDEDNVGDSCDRCTDRDNDRFGDVGFTVTGCRGSFFQPDNCPATHNPDQADYDQDASLCPSTTLQPYTAIGSRPECNDALGFPLGNACQFCGGDACDLDADGDRCYNWEQLKRQPGHDQNPRLSGGVALETLPSPNYKLFREEGYAKTLLHQEIPWRSYSRDVDVDGMADDCDVQACGNRVIENARRAVPLATLEGLTSVWVRELGPGTTNKEFLQDDKKLVQMISEDEAKEVLADGMKRDAMCDFASGNDGDPECYDIYFSDADSSLNQNGGYLTITAWRKPLGTTSHNIDAVRLDFSDGSALYADKVTHVELGELEAGDDPRPNKALDKEDGVATQLGDIKASITLGFDTDSGVNQCVNVVSGAQTCEECDANNFSVGSRCDNPYAAGARVTYRQLYPLQSVTPVLFLAHFNGMVDAFSGGGTKISPSPGSSLAVDHYPDGLADGSVDAAGQPVQLGQSLKFEPGNSLAYPAGSLYQAGERTASVWVKVSQEVKSLSPFSSTVQLGTSWLANSWHHLALTWDTLGEAGGFITLGNLQLYGDGLLIASEPSLTLASSDFAQFDIRKFLTTFGLNSQTVQLDELEFRSEKLDATTIAARFTAVSNQCLGPAAVSHDRYMVENFCAVCNNLRCQASVLRTCRPISLADNQLKQCFDDKKKRLEQDRANWQAKPENRTDFLWVLDNPTNNSDTNAGIVRKMVAIDGVQTDKLVKLNIGDNFGNAGVGAAGEKVVGNFGDFSVFIADDSAGKSPYEFSRAWVPFEDNGGASGGPDDGALREIKLDSDLNSVIKRECFLGKAGESSGVIGSTVDTRGNSWALFAGRRDVLMQYQEINAGGRQCNNTEPSNAISVYRLHVGGEDIHAMEVDRSNNLWLVRKNSTVKVDLEWIYDNVNPGVETAPRKESVITVVISGTTCNVTAKNRDGTDVTDPCSVFSTPDAGEIAINADGHVWVAKYTDKSNIVYFIRDGEPVQSIVISQEYLKPRYLTVDIENYVWVTVEKDKNNKDVSAVLRLGTAPFGPTGVKITPSGETTYGIAADSMGYLWVMHENGDGTDKKLAQLSRWKVSDGSAAGIYTIMARAFKRPTIGAWTRSAIRTGLSPRIIRGWLDLTETAAGRGSVYHCEVATNFTAVASAAVNWQNRWGKIFYDVNPATPGLTAFVSVASDLALVGSQWIAVDEFNRRVGQAPLISLSQAVHGEKGEIVGKYLRIRFEVPTGVSVMPSITNVRITCRDAAGRNICRG